MKFLIVILLLLMTLNAKTYSTAQVKKEYYKVQEMIKNGELRVKKRGWDGGNILEKSRLYTDKNGIVRFFLIEGGTEDSAHKGEYTYDKNGKLIFSYIRDANVRECLIEIRSYYSGSRLLKRDKKIEKCKAQRIFPLREDNPRKAFREVDND